MTTDRPIYQHDCERCRYLGQDVSHPGESRCNVVDLYVCYDPKDSILIRRYSSEPSNHGAMSISYAGHRYAEAKRRAALLGTVK